MWYKSESIEKPPVVDTDSSKAVAYVRKDFEQVEREDITYWTYFEQKIPKADWEVYQMAMQNTNDISDNTDAIVELAGLIAEMMEG